MSNMHKPHNASRAAWTESWNGFPDKWSGVCGGYDVFAGDSVRISALLGPDGEPLMVGYERPSIGFDLRRRT